MAKAKGSFAVTSWNEETYEDRGGDAKLTRAWGDQTFSGGIEGDGMVMWLMSYRPDGSAHYIGLQRIRGSVAGHAGSFIIEAAGEFDGTRSKGTWAVIEGSGSGDITDLSGKGTFRAGPGPKATYALDYRLAPAAKRAAKKVKPKTS
jgi:hypothetical protein